MTVFLASNHFSHRRAATPMPSRVVPFRSKQPLWQERGDLLPKDLGVPKNEKARRSLLSVLLLKVSTWRISCGWGLFKGPYLRPYNFEDLSFTDFSFHGPNCLSLVEKSLGLERKKKKLFSFFLAQNVFDLLSYSASEKINKFQESLKVIPANKHTRYGMTFIQF